MFLSGKCSYSVAISLNVTEIESSSCDSFFVSALQTNNFERKQQMKKSRRYSRVLCMLPQSHLVLSSSLCMVGYTFSVESGSKLAPLCSVCHTSSCSLHLPIKLLPAKSTLWGHHLKDKMMSYRVPYSRLRSFLFHSVNVLSVKLSSNSKFSLSLDFVFDCS